MSATAWYPCNGPSRGWLNCTRAGCVKELLLANLHNARKGKVPVVNIVGDHATYHVKYDATIQVIASVIRSGKKTALLMGGHSLRAPT
ncbi:hypothetical protein [Marinobacter sp. ATCH36]|uniref:hypothetical protein n=1 Tax=Marinobacter sp. ATCH36 TaxID=2945106 RepID=UPI002021C142|nr:hypothetical protein [Marinobacter sp. ATCH36]MCL7942369.1 hypothetical protein [Marinobacter sp. ATCH36]